MQVKTFKWHEVLVHADKYNYEVEIGICNQMHKSCITNYNAMLIRLE